MAGLPSMSDSIPEPLCLILTHLNGRHRLEVQTCDPLAALSRLRGARLENLVLMLL